jgi:uncharacterized protein YecT (DUF1311 family)
MARDDALGRQGVSMRGLSSAVLAVALLAISPCSGALGADTVEDIHRQCGEEYADPISVAKCLAAEEKDYGKRLATTYQKVVELQTPGDKQVLVEAQRAWLKFQEKNCQFTSASCRSKATRTARRPPLCASCGRRCSDWPSSKRCCPISSTEL